MKPRKLFFKKERNEIKIAVQYVKVELKKIWKVSKTKSIRNSRNKNFLS
jgi:hypothetical protein